jgi:hypothetical protein
MLHKVIEMTVKAVLLDSPPVRHGFLRITKCTELPAAYACEQILLHYKNLRFGCVSNPYNPNG